MKRSIGFVCIGQAGGNIGQLLEKEYDCLFINTSREDLNTLDVKYKYHIPEGEGCNKDREKAILLMKKHYRRIIAEIVDKIGHKDLIYLVGAAGGGTGSGIIPLLIDMLTATFPDKHFGCIIILPSLSELPKPQMNAYYCYQELSKLENIASVFTLDNERGDKFTINRTFVQLFNDLIDIPNHTDIRGNIDKAEIRAMLYKRGYAIITSCDNNNHSLSSSIIESWENNIFAPLENDKKIVYLGLSLTDDVDLLALQKVTGVPFDSFCGYNKKSTISILSGLSFPKERIEKILLKLNSSKDTIKESLSNSQTSKIDIKSDFFKEFAIFERSSTTRNIDIADFDIILKKYTV